MDSTYLLVLSLTCLSRSVVRGHLELETPLHAFDQDLYEDVLDEEQCTAQLSFISNNTLLRSRFLDAGYRTPRSILLGNLVDLGNYYQCLAISQDSDEAVIGGKYCSINIPLEQNNLQWPTLSEWPELQKVMREAAEIDEETKMKLGEFELKRRAVGMLSGDADRTSEGNVPSGMALTIAVCIPRPCSTQQALDSLLLNLTATGFTYSDNYCRLPNDKPWITADTVAAVVFGLLGLLTILSTYYDVSHNVILKKDPKTVNQLYQSFSVYTNARRLVTIKSTPKTIECLDGLRVLAMAWVIIGHTFSTQLQTHLLNPLDSLDWLNSLHSIWITAAPISVDTFFMLSGVLLVYATAGKFSRMNFLKNVHLFYLNRLLRMFPILATACLLHVSWFNHMADGPNWQAFIRHIHNCRAHWWSTLIHLQNYINPTMLCLGHTWYLAVDIQLHILSPLVLFWVLTSRRAAWIALTAALAAMLAASTTYNALKGFSFALVNAGRLEETNWTYMRDYYINTLTRGSPMLVGMIFGYWLVVAREKKIRMKRTTASLFWCLSLVTLATVVYITYPTQLASWNEGIWDVIFNSFLRPTWAAALGWLVFACANGYGGPLNWFLSLDMWKIPSKLSYAMYIFHYPLILAVNATAVQPPFFSDSYMIYRFFADFFLAIFVAFFATLLIDSPFSTLIRLALTGQGTAKAHQKPPVVTTHSTHLESKTQL